MDQFRSKLGKAPKMTEVFGIHETPINLAQQMKTATPIPISKVTQNAQNALKNQKNTLQGVQKTQGTTVKMGKTDVNNPIANIFVTKPDGSADVMDATTGELKPVPQVGQSKPSDPMQNAGVAGMK
jgi:hypothetical protein